MTSDDMLALADNIRPDPTAISFRGQHPTLQTRLRFRYYLDSMDPDSLGIGFLGIGFLGIGFLGIGFLGHSFLGHSFLGSVLSALLLPIGFHR